MEKKGEVTPVILDPVEKKHSKCRFPGRMPPILVDMIIKNLTPEEARICSLLSTETYDTVETLYEAEGAIIEFRTNYPTFNRLFGMSCFSAISNGVNSNILKPSFKIVGSLKGLICATNLHISFMICNPLTSQKRFIPKFPIVDPPSLDRSLVGFGFTLDDKYYIIVIPVVNQQPSGAWLYNSEQRWVPIDAGTIPTFINFEFGKPGKYCTLHDSPLWLLDGEILGFSRGQFTSYPLPLLKGKKIERMFSVEEKLVGVSGSDKGFVDLENGVIEEFIATASIPKEKGFWLLKNGGAVVMAQKNGCDVFKEGELMENHDVQFIDNVSNEKPNVSLVSVAGVQRVHSHVFNLRNVKE